MTLTRRHMLGCATAMTVAPRFSIAETLMGTGVLTTVSDGNLVLPGELVFAPMPKDMLAPILTEFALSPTRLEPECNLALYRDGTNTVLFDVGSGPDFMPSSGRLQDGLEAVGLSPEDVTHVLFTHAHPDHIWGLLDEFDDPLFAEAQYMMGRAEWEYWWDPETVNTIGDVRQAFAAGAKRRMERIADQVTLFDDGEEVMQGIAAVASYGHTPGHMAFELRQGGTAAMIVGDAIANHHVALRHPDWHSGSDQDMATAAATRAMLLERLTREDMSVVGFHLPGGGMGRIDRMGNGFQFIPA